MKIIWICNCLRLLKFPFCHFEGLKKVLVFKVKLWSNGKRTRLHFWMRESSNCVEHTEKENFHFPIVPHFFLRLGRPAPKFRQTCMATQKQLIFRGFLWIPCAKKQFYGLLRHVWSLLYFSKYFFFFVIFCLDNIYMLFGFVFFRALFPELHCLSFVFEFCCLKTFVTLLFRTISI